MDRRAKVELFEQIRREYEHGSGTIRGIAKKLGIHRRMVREAVLSAIPIERKTPVRERPKLEPAMAFIDAPASGFDGQEDANFRYHTRVGTENSKDNRKCLADALLDPELSPKVGL